MTAAPLKNTAERQARTSNGGLMLLATLAGLGALIWVVIDLIRYEESRLRAADGPAGHRRHDHVGRAFSF